MEVILKKSKITASILKQSLISVQSDFKKSICLGWVFYLKTKYMVLYDPETKVTTKYLVIKSIEKYSPQKTTPRHL